MVAHQPTCLANHCRRALASTAQVQLLGMFSLWGTSNRQLARRAGPGRRRGRARGVACVCARASCLSAVVYVILHGKRDGQEGEGEEVGLMQLQQAWKGHTHRRTHRRTQLRLRAACFLAPKRVPGTSQRPLGEASAKSCRGDRSASERRGACIRSQATPSSVHVSEGINALWNAIHETSTCSISINSSAPAFGLSSAPVAKRRPTPRHMPTTSTIAHAAATVPATYNTGVSFPTITFIVIYKYRYLSAILRIQ